MCCEVDIQDGGVTTWSVPNHYRWSEANLLQKAQHVSYKQLHSEFKKFEPHTTFEQNFNQIIKSSHFQQRRIFDMNESKHSWRFVGSLHTFSSRHNQYFMWSGHMTVAWLHIYELINIQLQRYKKIQTNYTSTAFLQDYKSLRFYKNIDISTT